jgi:hypothetical protein
MVSSNKERVQSHRIINTHRTRPLKSSRTPPLRFDFNTSSAVQPSLGQHRHENQSSQRILTKGFTSVKNGQGIHNEPGYHHDHRIENNSPYEYDDQYSNQHGIDGRHQQYQYNDQLHCPNQVEMTIDDESEDEQHQNREGSQNSNYHNDAELESNDESTGDDSNLSEDSSGAIVSQRSGNEYVGGLCILLTVGVLVASVFICWQRRMEWFPSLFGNALGETSAPSIQPSIYPSWSPSIVPSMLPSSAPTAVPTLWPSRSPSFYPSSLPSLLPTNSLTTFPSLTPTTTDRKYLNVDSWNQVGDNISAIFGADVTDMSLSFSHDGTCIAAGYMVDPYETGIVRIFKLSESNQREKIGQDLKGNFTMQYFGYSIALSNACNLIVVGAHSLPSNLNVGQVQIYRHFNNTWIPSESWIKGMSINYGYEWNADGIGWEVDLSDNGNIIAASGISNRLPNGMFLPGRLEVYNYSYEDDSLTQIGQSIFSKLSFGIRFGHSFSLSSDGDIIAIGDYSTAISGMSNAGSVQLFNLVNNNWVQFGQLKGIAPEQRFGKHVSLSADASTLAIGTKSIDDGEDEVLTFLNNNDTWRKFGDNIPGRKPSLSADGNLLATITSTFSQIFVQTQEGWLQIGPDLLNSTGESVVSISGNGHYVAASSISDNVGLLRIFEGFDSV